MTYVIYCFGFVISAFGLMSGVGMLRKTLNYRKWPKTSGQIIERKTITPTVTASSRPGRYREPYVRYTYQVDGKEYTGDRLWPIKKMYGEADTTKLLNAIPNTVDVYYNPQNPTESLLYPSVLSWTLLLLGLSVIGLGLSVGLFLRNYLK